MPVRGLYARHACIKVWPGWTRSSRGSNDWRKRITEAMIGEEAEQIPPEWYQDDWDALARLLERSTRAASGVRELILSARNSGRDPFPNWKVRHA